MQFAIDQYHLQVEIDTKECELTTEERATLQPDLERIGQVAQEFPSSQLWLTIVHHPRSRKFHAQAKLKLPGHTIITGYQNESLLASLRGCLGRVLRRVEAYRLEPDDQALRLAHGQARLNEVIAPVEPDAGTIGRAVQSDDYGAFRQALLGHEEYLRMRVGRWVQRFPEVQAAIGQNLEIADIVEEVFLLAFEQYANRPTHVALHEWLDGLIDPAVKALWNDPEELRVASLQHSFTRAEW